DERAAEASQGDPPHDDRERPFPFGDLDLELQRVWLAVLGGLEPVPGSGAPLLELGNDLAKEILADHVRAPRRQVLSRPVVRLQDGAVRIDEDEAGWQLLKSLEERSGFHQIV